MDIDRKQRTDIDEISDDRLTLAIDSFNMVKSTYSHSSISEYGGINWLHIDGTYVKYNLVEKDSLILKYKKIGNLAHKNIKKIKVSFDYEIENQNSIPILNNISLIHNSIDYKILKLPLNNIGHIDEVCDLFGIDNEVLNTIISEQGFGIGLNFDGNKSNATIKISNILIDFEFENKLQEETNTVVNRLTPEIDFYRDENGDLILQIGDGASGKGADHSGSGADTYSKEQIDNKLSTKVNVEIGKGLSSNDYTFNEKTKLSNIENNANYYIHPSTHNSNIIVESSPLNNIGTDEESTQHEINLAIDDKFANVVTDIDWSDIQNKPSDYPPSTHNHTVNDISDFPNVPSNISDLVNDSDFIEKSNVSGLVKNDGSIDTTTYLSSLPSHTHGHIRNEGYITDSIGFPNTAIPIVQSNNQLYKADNGVNSNIIKNLDALSNIGTSQYATQRTINSAIDTALSNKTNTSDLGDVALSNDYNDLDNLPTIPTIPSNISAFNNDVGYLTQHQSLANYIQKSNVNGLVKNDGTIDTTNYLSSLPSHNHDDRYYTESEVDTALNSKQDTLISGTSIKTINNTSLLGSGNISIGGGGSPIEIVTSWESSLSDTKVPSEKLAKDSLDGKTDVGHTHEDREIDSSYTNIEMNTLILATLDDVIAYNEPFTRINRALEHMIDNWEDYD